MREKFTISWQMCVPYKEVRRRERGGVEGGEVEREAVGWGGDGDGGREGGREEEEEGWREGDGVGGECGGWLNT